MKCNSHFICFQVNSKFNAFINQFNCQRCYNHSINIWKDPWLPNSQNFQPAPSSAEDPHSNIQWVHQLFIPGTKVWDRDLILRLFSPSSAADILAVKPLQSQHLDSLKWIHKANGTFNTRSAYLVDQAPRLHSSILNPQEWQKLWRAKIHDRHKLLLWKLCTSALPTRNILAQRMPLQDHSCVFCHNFEEKPEHLLLHYPYSTIIWSLIKHPVRIQTLQHLNLIDWIRIIPGIDTSLAIPFDLSYDFLLQAVITFDVIWQTRNSCLHGSFDAEPRAAATTINKRLETYKSAWESKALHLGTSSKPPSSTTQPTLSFDVAFGNNKSWLAAIYCSSMGSISFAWTKQSSNSDPFTGEVEAASFAIQCAKSIELTDLLLQGDSKDAIDSLLYRTSTGRPDIDLLQSVLRVDLETFVSWDAVYIPRNCNFLAHNLAKWASFCNHSGPIPISSLPLSVLRREEM